MMNRKSQHGHDLSARVAVAALLLAPAVQAQDEAMDDRNVAIDEIIVTSQAREESFGKTGVALSKVPQNIQVLGGFRPAPESGTTAASCGAFRQAAKGTAAVGSTKCCVEARPQGAAGLDRSATVDGIQLLRHFSSSLHFGRR